MAITPRLPDYVGVPVAQQSARGSRLPASAINKQAPTTRERTITVAAEGQPIPIVYGRTNVPGLLFAQGLISTDLVLGYALCVGEIDAIEMVQINDVDASTISGVTVTTYRGLATQTVDSTLSSAIAAFNDSMRFDEGNGLRGIAYVVLRITTEASVGGFPRLRATVRGRKVYDPRTGLTTYSDNSALCMADLITDPDYGLGGTVSNLTAAANWCDSLLADGSTKRARLGIVLGSPSQIVPDLLDLFSTYAECFWVHEGSAIKLVPDQAVTLASVPLITDWVRDSLSIRHADNSDSPDEIELIYQSTRTDAAQWQTAVVRRKLSGVSARKSTVRMDGVVTLAEADNKALARLNRLQSRVTVSFSAFDGGVEYQPGDVIRLASAARGIADMPVRILSVGMQEPGRYAVSGDLYDASHYPSEVPPVAGGALPSGAIILRPDASTPAGLEAFSAADSKLIVGAGGAYAQGATGGSGWSVSFSGNTTTDGGHSSGPGGFSSPASVFGGSPVAQTYPTGTVGSPSHKHTFSSGSITLNPLRQQRRLIKASSTLTTVPSGCQMLGVSGISATNWVRDTGPAGRVLEASSSNASVGAASQTASLTTGSTSDAHRHTASPTSSAQAAFATADLFSSVSGGASHSHTATLSVVAALKRRGLALYTATGDAAVPPGMIALWDGGAVPSNWVLCDGTNQTPDMRDYFAEIVSGASGTAAGDNTATATATTDQRGHSHRGGDVNNDMTATGGGHGGTVYHDHDISSTVAITPAYYALAFIMHQPGS
ncbi:MAG: phage tail protein [Pseudomonadota bacterium]